MNHNPPKRRMPRCRTASAQSSRAGANGIGQAFYRRLAKQGATVVIADIADSAETLTAIKKDGGSTIAVRCDQTSKTEVGKLRGTVEQELGGCDILVHCAGIYPTEPIEEITFDQWRKVLSVNLDSVALLVKAYLPGMKDRRWGVDYTRLFNDVSLNRVQYSLHGKQGGLGPVAGLRSRRFRDHRQHRCTGVDAHGYNDKWQGSRIFGWFEMIRSQQAVKRTETPEDLTGTLAFLASDDAAFITGQIIVVDGGWRFS
jgi:NAD(P)-dependent dehydrogenase (short-subunit alcohol dehydrogenase family)